MARPQCVLQPPLKTQALPPPCTRRLLNRLGLQGTVPPLPLPDSLRVLTLSRNRLTGSLAPDWRLPALLEELWLYG